MNQPSRYWVHAAVFTVALIYGVNYSVMKTITPQYILPLGVVLIRVFSAAVLFWFLAPRNEKIESKKDYGRLALCALFGVALNQIFYVKGLALTLPTNAAVMMTSTPIMVLVVSAFLLGEKITLRKGIGILLGFTGAFLLFSKGGVQFSGDTFLGDIMVLVNALSYGVYLVLVKQLMVKYKPLTVVKWIFTIGLIYVLPFGLADFQAIEWGAFGQNQYAALGFIIVFVTLLTYLLNGWALQHISPSVVGYYIYLQPVIATIVALVFRGDKLTLQTVLFSLLIFAGVFLVSWNPKGKTMSN